MKLNNSTKTFLWTLLNGVVSIIITYLSGIDYIYTPLIIASLNLLTKSLNKAFNPDYVEESKDVESLK